jgi:hypothetical protein
MSNSDLEQRITLALKPFADRLYLAAVLHDVLAEVAKGKCRQVKGEQVAPGLTAFSEDSPACETCIVCVAKKQVSPK